MKKAIVSMIDRCKENIIKEAKKDITILHADNQEMASFALKELKERVGEEINVNVLPIGPVIGAHCGPGTVGIIYYGKER